MSVNAQMKFLFAAREYETVWKEHNPILQTHMSTCKQYTDTMSHD